MALLRGLPDRGHRGGRDRRSRCRCSPTVATTSTRWPPRSPTAPGSCWSARPTTRPARRSPRPSSTRSSRRCPPHVLVVVDEAYVEFVRMDDPVDGLATYRAPRERRAHPHLLQGLRAGRLPGRVRRRARADRRRAAGGLAAVRRLDRRPGGGDRLARARGRAARAGRGAGRRADPRRRRRCATPAGTSPRRRATSSGSSSATGPPTSPPPPTSSASWSARSPARAPGSRSARTEANDRLLILAKEFQK